MLALLARAIVKKNKSFCNVLFLFVHYKRGQRIEFVVLFCVLLTPVYFALFTASKSLSMSSSGLAVSRLTTTMTAQATRKAGSSS